MGWRRAWLWAVACLPLVACGGGHGQGGPAGTDAGTLSDSDGGGGPTGDGGGGLASDQEAALTRTHNAVRADATPAPDPPLEPLTWDPTVAAYAQTWAEHNASLGCPTTGDVHSHGPYGENMYWSSGGATPEQVVVAWASESSHYDYALNACYGGLTVENWIRCGHYTQIVWRATTLLGCGVAPCDGGDYGQVWVCSYSPPGNICDSQTLLCQRPY